MYLEPVAGEFDHGLKRARFLEEMRRPRHDLQLLRSGEPGERAPVEVQNRLVRATDNEQNRRTDPLKGSSGEVRPPVRETTPGQEMDVENVTAIAGLAEEVDEQSRKAAPAQALGDKGVAGTVPAAAAAMGENDEPARVGGTRQFAFE